MSDEIDAGAAQAGQQQGSDQQAQQGQGQGQVADQGAGQGSGGAPAQQQRQAAAADKTLASGAEPTGKEPPTALPENWRTLAAGGDKDVETLLGRYKSLTDVGAALKNMRAELSKKGQGAKTEPPGDDATDEEKAEWRKANGIPEKPEDYGNALKLPEGMVLGEADKPVADSFFKAAHAKGMPQSVVNGALEWYFQHKEANEIARQNADAETFDATTAALREEWGAADFKRNQNAIMSTIGSTFGKYGDDLFDQFTHARLPDGTRLGDSAEVMRALADIALQVDPGARIMPADVAATGKSIASRKADIETMMRDQPDKYWADNKVQEEYRNILDAEARLASRRAA